MNEIIVGGNQKQEKLKLLLKMANRHGLIAGATGTGKTITLKVLAEQFSSSGVPVFLVDVKGDLSGFITSGSENEEVTRRVNHNHLEDFRFTKFPTVFWDLYGQNGHSIRTTVSEMGPILLSRLLELNQTQEDIIMLAFKYADDEGMLLLDLKDLKEVVQHLGKADEKELDEYGKIAKSSVGAITRRLTALAESGGDFFFGEPALNISDFLKKDLSGNGVINVLDARKLMLDQKLYSTFLLWFLSELFEELPEVGDMEKPNLVFFFDEAHLIFNNISKPLFEKLEMVVKLIRSKGVGVYFITQNPSDIPSEILSQLGNRIIHGLRAFTEKERSAVKSIASSFRVNPEMNLLEEITNLKRGESLVSFLDEEGAPGIVEKVLNSPPRSKMGPAADEQIIENIKTSPYSGKYDEMVDRESAFEILVERKKKALEKVVEKPVKEKAKKSTRQGPFEALLKSILRAVGSQLGRQIVRGIMGSFKR